MDAAHIVQQVIGVDKELRPYDIEKTMTTSETDDGAQLHLYVDRLTRTMRATTLRHMRLALNAFLEDTALIVRTMSAFPTPELAGAAGGATATPHAAPAAPLEHGTTGVVS